MTPKLTRTFTDPEEGLARILASRAAQHMDGSQYVSALRPDAQNDADLTLDQA